tara:strand:- start:231 stop:1277 length:1047 start_codon:yes stop_codon:yes gene_type:complete
MKFFKIIFFNLTIFLTFVLFFELFFGYWFDKDNLGPYMREHRMKNQRIEYEFDGVKEVYFYRRNYHGFRGEDIEPSEIKAIIMGSSNIEQRYEPDRYTITGFLNSNLKQDNMDLKIINAGVEAMSTRGMILGFKNWLFKLKDFSPKIILLYVGITDYGMNDEVPLDKHIQEGHLLNPSLIEQIKDNIKSRSIILDSIRVFKFKYLPRKGFVKYDGNQDPQLKENFNYIDYDAAKNKYDLVKLRSTYNKKIKNYLLRIDKLHELALKLNSKPIFITNISSGGYVKAGFILNTSLIDHCKEKNYQCIDLAKKLDSNLSYWKDGTHTSNIGSRAIADLIYPDLKKILLKLN